MVLPLCFNLQIFTSFTKQQAVGVNRVCCVLVCVGRIEAAGNRRCEAHDSRKHIHEPSTCVCVFDKLQLSLNPKIPCGQNLIK